ncbi:MAG: SDR family oxidoreductase [Pseudomonadota bacterium]
MTFSIEGKTAIVTGAANGIGLAIGRHFLDQGARVMFADMDEDGLVSEVGDVPDDAPAHYFAGDLREKLTINNLLSATIDHFDRVDILVNAARQIMPSDPLDPDDESIKVMLDQNLTSALRLSQLVANRMVKQGEEKEEGQLGSIVNITSIAARRAQPELLGYSVATAALEQMTRAMAVALSPKRIRVNAVAFGSVMSASLQNALKEHAPYRDEIEAHTPLGRIASPGELAEAVQYLASDGAGFVTGEILTVDGGRTLIDPVSAPAH